MNKSKFFLSLSILLIIPSLVMVAFAHPGRTDGSGGHTDHSTGEYHYHHGQSAHDHYDMDGDGDLDCPYDFRDNTDRDDGRSASSDENTSDVSHSAENKNDYSLIKILLQPVAILAVSWLVFYLFIMLI